MNSIMIEVYNSLLGVADNLKGFNDNLIYLLSMMEIVLALTILVVYESQQAVKKFIMITVVVIAFNGVLVIAPSILSTLFNGVMELAVNATGQNNLSPTDIFNNGFELVTKLTSMGLRNSSWSNLGGNLLIWFSILVCVLFVFTLLAADLFILYIRFYVYSVLSGTLIALGVFKPTREMFWNFCKALAGLLIFLFTFMMLISMFLQPVKEWTKEINAVTATAPEYGKGKYSNVSYAWCHFKYEWSSDTAKKMACDDYAVEELQLNDRVDKFYAEYGIKMIITLILVFITIKTICPWFASIVGFGSYDTKGMGMLGQMANIVSRGVSTASNARTKASSLVGNTIGKTGVGKTLAGAGKGLAKGSLKLNPVTGAIEGAKNARTLHKAGQIAQQQASAERLKKASDTVQKVMDSKKAPVSRRGSMAGVM